ncbi:hypothetical protein LguiB_025582 [Lonicera macranthoides]
MEYKATSFLKFLREQGTISQYSCPGTSQQNGRAERKHRHILDTVRTLLISSSCPERFWGEAALTAIYTINRIPVPFLQHQSPYERLHGTSPDYNFLRVFGCACFVLLQPHEHSKLEPRARLCCFLGYGIEHKGYRCWDPVSKCLRISRHVVFWEHKMFSSLSKFHVLEEPLLPFFTHSSLDLSTPELETPVITSPPEPDPKTTLPPHSVSTPYPTPEAPPPPPPQPLVPPSAELFTPSSSDIIHSDEPQQTVPPNDDVSPADPIIPQPQRQSTRVKELPHYLRDYHCYSTMISHYEPSSYKEASTNPLWQQAMTEELQALDKAHTWDLVNLPPGKSAVGCKWVYKIKTRSDGSIDRYKARLVAKGFNQEYGIDYEETFAPVARMTSVRSLIAIAAVRKWDLFQMDVKNAFLNEDLTEEVYMKPPPGYSHQSTQVCKLRRALYGLKQAPRAWFAKFSSTITKLGYSSSTSDSGLFIRKTDSGIIFLLLYVDDMIITGDDLSGISNLKKSLSRFFEMKDLGRLNYFLGLEVLSDSTGYYLSQVKYTSDVLARVGLTDSKTASTPLDTNVRLTPFDGTPLSDGTLYRQLVGSLVYLTVTRPDIAYAVHVVSQFMSAPRSTHFDAVLRILRYLKGTMFYGLHYSSRSSLVLRAYSDADWAGDPTDRRSITGYCFFLGDSLLTWRSKKQSVVSRSSTEAEYRALADTSQELIWLRRLLDELGAPQASPTTLYCDNRSAIQISHNDVFHGRTKHIEIDCHFIRQHIRSLYIRLMSVTSDDQPADLFTKAHQPSRFQALISKLQLVSHLPP